MCIYIYQYIIYIHICVYIYYIYISFVYVTYTCEHSHLHSYLTKSCVVMMHHQVHCISEVSVKFLMTMICVALIAICILAQKYHETQQKLRRDHVKIKIAAITTIIIFIGQIIWIALTRLAKHLKWESWIKQELQTPKIRTSVAPKQRATAVMSH